MISFSSFAQKVEKDGKTYEVKKEKIFLNGEDVTETLNLEEKQAILKEAETISEKIKTKEKALKKEKKAKDNYKRAQDKLAKAQKKYEKLKKKGKLSPVDEEKWLEKIENLTEKVEKAKKKL